MQQSSWRKENEPIDIPSRLGKGCIDDTTRRENYSYRYSCHQCPTNSNSYSSNRRRRSNDNGTYTRTRRTPFPGIQFWSSTTKQQLLSSMVMMLFVILVCDDVSLRIATAFPICPISRSSTTSSSTSSRRPFLSSSPIVSATMILPSIVSSRVIRRKQQQQQQHHKHRQLFSTSADKGGDNDGIKSKEIGRKQPPKHSYKWTKKTLALALPALIGMLVDPLLSMMDTAYVGNLGSSIELAALGACTSIFHLAFNAFRATTAATTSLVGNASSELEKREIIRISLSLGVVMGLGVAGFLRVLGPWCLAAMGISGVNSPLYAPGFSYLRTRALAAPAVLAIMVSEGAFRGYGNTKIPLMASATAAMVNLMLDPILMLPPLSKGVQGAAAATAFSQFGALGVYLWFLKKRKMLPQPSSNDESSATRTTKKSKVIKTILGANLAMFCKQGSLLLAWAYATAKATRIGQAHVAAHQVALSCWLVFALLQDGAGVASQVLLTKILSKEENKNYKNNNNSHEKLVSLVKYMLKVSVIQGLIVTCGFLLVSPYLPGWFVPDDLVVRGHLQKLLPHVAGQQLLVSLTLVLESLAVGGKQFRTLAVGTALSTVVSGFQIRSATTVVGVWSRGIVGLFAGRLVTAIIGTLKVVRHSRKQAEAQKQQKS